METKFLVMQDGLSLSPTPASKRGVVASPPQENGTRRTLTQAFLSSFGKSWEKPVQPCSPKRKPA